MVKVLLNLPVLAAAIGLAVGLVVKHSGMPFWTYYPAIVLLALVCYCASTFLTFYSISKRAPEFLSDEETVFGLRKWELTAGLGIVPKWVSLIGLCAFASLLALLMPVVAPWFK